MKNHLLEKLHPNLTGGTPLNIFKILKNLTEKKVTGLSRSSGKKNQKISNLLVAHRLLGAPLVTEKKFGLKNFFGIFFQNIIRNMIGKFEIFFQNLIILMNMNKVVDISKVQ